MVTTLVTTFEKTPAAASQLIAHFRQNGYRYEEGDMYDDTMFCLTDNGIEYTMTVEDETGKEVNRFYIGADEVNASDVYVILFQI
jgi:hypothetical protein